MNFNENTGWRRPLACVAMLALCVSVMAAESNPDDLIPFDKLDAAGQARVRLAVPGYTFYRKVQLAHPLVRSRYDVFEHVINHLDQCSIVAQPLKIVEYRSERQPDGSYFADNHKGAVGHIWPLRAVPGERLYYAHGDDREGKMVSGCAVVLFRYREKAPGVIEGELHAFVKIDSWVQKLLTILFTPIVTAVVDRRFNEVVDVPTRVAEESTANPAKVLAVIDAMPPKDREMVAEFRKLLATPEKKP
ncbi:MAG: hypothetical protein HZA91_10580 [Verrucomicrobia bacterium]|nr:hypothetical protein [Verrucomicrobiota bacterium]